MKKIVSVLIILTNFYFVTSAQLVNIEKKRKETKQGFQGDITFSLKITENTKQIIEGSNGVNLQYTKKGHTILVESFTKVEVKLN